MDYENKYKEAQKWIESIYSELSHEQQMEAEAFFPELKESENEKIRKWLISQLKIKSDDTNFDLNIMIDKAISWLEKQAGKDKLIQELGKYKVKYTQEVLEKHINSKSNKDDERLRKTTIAFLKDFAEQGYENAIECIDWLEKQGYTKKDVDDAYLKGICNTKHELEKQGERKPTDKIEIGKKYQCIASPRYSTFRRGEIYKPVDNFLCNLMNLCSDCFEPIEDSEHNPILDFKAKDWYVSKVDGKIHNIYNSVDKVEPKFHEGEWITNGDYTWKIVEIKPLDYILQSQDGNIVDDTISHVDEQFHSFTIEDAKDGDLLAGKIDGDNYILIFKQIKDGWIETHGHYYNTVDRFCAPSQLFCKDYKGVFHPATKPQRDALFAKMKEAGYEWSEETRELKKISQRTISAEAKEALYDRPAWSEDDENILEDIKEAVINTWVGDTQDIILDWLKQLKQRIGG